MRGPSLRAEQSIRHTTDRHTREGGYPVRRGLSVQSSTSLGYWVTRPSAQLRTRQVTTTECTLAISRRDAPEVCNIIRPEEEGAGNAGCRLAPAVACANSARDAHTSIQVQPEHPGIPCAVGLRHIPRAPRRRIPLASVAGRLKILRSPVGIATSRRLDTSNGCQDHTALPYGRK